MQQNPRLCETEQGGRVSHWTPNRWIKERNHTRKGLTLRDPKKGASRSGFEGDLLGVRKGHAARQGAEIGRKWGKVPPQCWVPWLRRSLGPRGAEMAESGAQPAVYKDIKLEPGFTTGHILG